MTPMQAIDGVVAMSIFCCEAVLKKVWVWGTMTTITKVLAEILIISKGFD